MEKELYIIAKKLDNKPLESTVRVNILQQTESNEYYELYCTGKEKDRFEHIIQNFRDKIENMVLLTVLVTQGEKGEVYEIKTVENFSD